MLGLNGEDPRELGPYRVRAVIGDGGMGRVYLGTSPAGRAVAVKVIGPGLADQPGYRQRFAHEANAAMAVSGIYTASVVSADTQGERPYIATEFVAAPSLADAVKAAGPLPAAAVSALAGGLAEALTAIHRAGLVHRDVKPHNILLATNGPVVIDFGIARSGESSLTATGLMIGTPGYIAPEVLRGHHPTPASDVFSLACVLVYAARGLGPFGTGEPLSLAHRTVNEPPDLAGVPDPIRVLVAPLLDADPTARATPAQLVRQISSVSGTAVLHGGTWLPDGVRALVAQREAEAQSVLGEGKQQDSPLPGPAPASAATIPAAVAGAGPQAPVYAAAAPDPAAAAYPYSAAQLAAGSAYPPPPPTGPTAPMDRRRGGMFAALGAVGTLIVVGVVATVIALNSHGSNPGSANQASTSHSPTSHSLNGSNAPSTSATSASAAPASSATTAVSVSYKPGTYVVNQVIEAGAFGDATLQTITINNDGSIAAKFTVLSAVSAEYTCAFSVPGETVLQTETGTADASSGSDCTKQPSKTWITFAGQTWSENEYFTQPPNGTGTWTMTFNMRALKGSAQGISIPTN